MQKTLPENIFSLYDQHFKSSIEDYKKTDHNSLKEKNYQYYYSRSMTELNAINTTQLKAECISIENQVNSRVKQLSQLKQRLDDNNITTKTLESSFSHSKIFTEKYSKEIQSLITQLNELLGKIDNLTNSPFDSMKKAKSEYENKCEFILQPLINSMIEKRKFYNLVIKEKESKLKIVDEKKTTLAENKMKIERLTKEFNENSEKMTNELKQNEIIQKELDQLIALNNKSQPSCIIITVPEDQLNIISSMKKKYQITMMSISEQLSMINYYQRSINDCSLKFVFFIFKIYLNILLRKKQIAVKREHNANIIKSKSDKEKLIKDFNDLMLLYSDLVKNEEKQQEILEKFNKRITKLESISLLL